MKKENIAALETENSVAVENGEPELVVTCGLGASSGCLPDCIGCRGCGNAIFERRDD